EFTGSISHEAIAQRLAEHRILIAPSLYHEPFGVVALEGIACGCVVIGSSGGGLPEAIGPCGRTFPNGDEHALAATIAELLGDPDSCARMLEGAAEHLAEHTIRRVAERYLAVLERAAQGRPVQGSAGSEPA